MKKLLRLRFFASDLPNKVLNLAVSDTTMLNSSNAACTKIK